MGFKRADDATNDATPLHTAFTLRGIQPQNITIL